MNRDVFRDMHAQMSPNDDIIESLFEKADKLPDQSAGKNRKPFWNIAIAVPAAAIVLVSGIFAMNAYSERQKLLKSSTDAYFASNTDDAGLSGQALSDDTTLPETTAVTTPSTTFATTITSTATTLPLTSAVTTLVETSYPVPTQRPSFYNGELVPNLAFPVFGYGSGNYGTIKMNRSSIAQANISGFIAKIEIKNKDNPEAVIRADIYEINGVSPDNFVAVKYESFDNYYLFINLDYKPETVYSLIEGCGLFNDVTWGDTDFIVKTDDEIKSYKAGWQNNNDFASCFLSAGEAQRIEKYDFLLNENREFKSVSTIINFKYSVAGSLDCGIKMGLTEEGYLFAQTDFGEYVYKIGAEACDTITQYIIDKGILYI